jgi:hypothetical protein
VGFNTPPNLGFALAAGRLIRIRGLLPRRKLVCRKFVRLPQGGSFAYGFNTEVLEQLDGAVNAVF